MSDAEIAQGIDAGGARALAAIEGIGGTAVDSDAGLSSPYDSGIGDLQGLGRSTDLGSHGYTPADQLPGPDFSGLKLGAVATLGVATAGAAIGTMGSASVASIGAVARFGLGAGAGSIVNTSWTYTNQGVSGQHDSGALVTAAVSGSVSGGLGAVNPFNSVLGNFSWNMLSAGVGSGVASTVTHAGPPSDPLADVVLPSAVATFVGAIPGGQGAAGLARGVVLSGAAGEAVKALF